MTVDQMVEAKTGTAITSWEVSTFTQGECWYLAWVLHSRTGWPVVLLRPSMLRHADDFDHVLVRIPDGRLLDVYGVQGDAEVLARWTPSGDLEEIDDEDAQRILGRFITPGPYELAADADAVSALLLRELNGHHIVRLHSWA